MSRVRQSVGQKGSQKWLQRAVAFRPDLLQPAGLAPITWVSPRAADDFAEYRDADFLWHIGLSGLAPMLQQFWPRGGPQWDGLGTFRGGVVLLEAKAHLDELRSSPTRAQDPSLSQIAHALDAVKTALGVDPDRDWTALHYQHANRLAHLWFLRKYGINAHLLLVGFCGDGESGGPAAPEEWVRAYRAAEADLGLPDDHALAPFVHRLFPDVATLDRSL